MTRRRRLANRFAWFCAAAAALLALLGAWAIWLNFRGESPLPGPSERFEATPQLVERGRYLALAGNCAGCHTARGGAPYAGGIGIETPFGTVYAGNLTPDLRLGIGQWSAADFWRAMHNGRSRDGRLLSPAFPYPSFTNITREDSDALYAWLRTLPPATVANRPHRLRFPYDTQIALMVWRALYFKPGVFVADPAKPADWNRGAYLVTGLGHCIACHGERNALGAVDFSAGLAGGTLAIDRWYAPSLTSRHEASVADWSKEEVIALLQTGTAPKGSVMGPMADVVYRSTQYLNTADLAAMATYLQQLPERTGATPQSPPPSQRDARVMERGGSLYDQQCAYCHGERGQGQAGAYPALAGNRAVGLERADNLIQAVKHGGFLPTTAGNPRPQGMPPFRHLLTDEEIAAVLTYVRASWGNNASQVTRQQVMRR